MKLGKNNKIFISVGLLVFMGMLLVFSLTANAKSDNDSINIYKKIKVFNEVLFKLQENYVEDLDINNLIDDAVKGMLKETDPHTNYFTIDEFKRFSVDTKGEFGGLGISIDKKGDYITVVSPIEGTPAYRMGIQAGDRIVSVDGESIVGISTDEAIKKMRGPKGTKVTIGIERPGVKEELKFDITRDIIKIKSIPYAFKLHNGIGYIRIRQFNANTTDELREQLDKLEAEGIRGLLIDLRFNPGGLLREAIDTVNEFIGKDKLVVYTKGRISQANMEYYTKYNRMRSGYPVVVLINEASASAAEIFAGSLQDWDKGLIVGKTSFGKGSVQRLFPLSDGSGIKITTAKYYIKSGRCIHKDINDKILKGEKVTEADKEEAEEEHLKDVHYTTRGRIVYGGGGINPDIEIDQSKITNLGVELRRKNTFFNYSVDYLVKHPDAVTKDFKVDDAIVKDFLDYAKKDSVEFSYTELDSTYNWIENEIDWNIISRKYGDVAGYKVLIKEDTQLQKALDIFDKYPTLDEMFKYSEELNKKTK